MGKRPKDIKSPFDIHTNDQQVVPEEEIKSPENPKDNPRYISCRRCRWKGILDSTGFCPKDIGCGLYLEDYIEIKGVPCE